MESNEKTQSTFLAPEFMADIISIDDPLDIRTNQYKLYVAKDKRDITWLKDVAEVYFLVLVRGGEHSAVTFQANLPQALLEAIAALQAAKWLFLKPKLRKRLWNDFDMALADGKVMGEYIRTKDKLARLNIAMHVQLDMRYVAQGKMLVEAQGSVLH